MIYKTSGLSFLSLQVWRTMHYLSWHWVPNLSSLEVLGVVLRCLLVIILKVIVRSNALLIRQIVVWRFFQPDNEGRVICGPCLVDSQQAADLWSRLCCKWERTADLWFVFVMTEDIAVMVLCNRYSHLFEPWVVIFHINSISCLINSLFSYSSPSPFLLRFRERNFC